MEDAHDDLKHLVESTEAPVPAFFKDLPPEQLHELRRYVDDVVAHETDGLDELYDTVSSLMGYVPNFILLPIIKSTIKPPIAAGVTAKLSVKEASRLAAGLPADYLGEVALHLDSEHAAAILSRLKLSLAKKCIAYEGEHHPAKTLDIGQHVGDDILKAASDYLHLLEGVDEVLLEEYGDLLERIRAFGE